MRPWALLGLTAACSPSLVVLPELPAAPGGSQLLAIVGESGPPRVFADERPAPAALLSLPDEPRPRRIEAHVFPKPLIAAGLFLRPGPQTLGQLPTDLAWSEVRARADAHFSLDLGDPTALAWVPLASEVDELRALDDVRIVETARCAETEAGIEVSPPPVPEFQRPVVATLLPHPDGVLVVVEDAAVAPRPFALFVVRPDGQATRVEGRLPSGHELLCRCFPNGFVNLCCSAATAHSVALTAIAADGRPLLAVRSCPNGDELGFYAVEGTTLVALGRRTPRAPLCDETKVLRQPDCSSWVERLEPPECGLDAAAVRQPRLLAFQSGPNDQLLLLSVAGTITPSRAELVHLGAQGEQPVIEGLERLPDLGDVDAAALLERGGGWLGVWGVRRTGDRHALFEVGPRGAVTWSRTDLAPSLTDILPSPFGGVALLVGQIGDQQGFLLEVSADRGVHERLVGDRIPPHGVSRPARPEEPTFVRQCPTTGRCQVSAYSPGVRKCGSWDLTESGDPSVFAPPGLWTWDGARLSSRRFVAR